MFHDVTEHLKSPWTYRPMEDFLLLNKLASQCLESTMLTLLIGILSQEEEDTCGLMAFVACWKIVMEM